MYTTSKIFILFIASILTACVNLPTGPSVMTLPGSGKSFDQFRFDDYQCRQFAYQQVGGTTTKQASISSGAESAAVGTGVGAAAGAAFGGGQGAAIGAGSGLLVGSMYGASAASNSAYANQYRYDMGYIQCMYAKGHRVPVSGQITSSTPKNNSTTNYRRTPNSTGFTPPPPPSGSPPPPPPQ